MGLKKVYVVTEISAPQDGSPYVLLTLREPSKIGGPQKATSQPSVASFRSMNDMFKNIGRIMSKQMMGGIATIIKLKLNEYEEFDFKVGDRISLEINKTRIQVL